MLATLLTDGKDFCRDGSHLGHFLRQTSPEMEFRIQSLGYGNAPADERARRRLVLVAHKVESIRKAEIRPTISFFFY